MKYFDDCTTAEQVTKVYRQLAKQNHPDKVGEVGTKLMQEITSERDVAIKKILRGEGKGDDYITSFMERMKKGESLSDLGSKMADQLEAEGVDVTDTKAVFAAVFNKVAGKFFPDKKQEPAKELNKKNDSK